MTYLQQSFFEEAARRHGNRVAIDDHGKIITYSELNKLANRLANFFISLSIRSNQRIAIYLNKNVNCYISILAVLKSGACWVPFPTNSPVEYEIGLINDVEPSIIVCEAANLSRVKLMANEADLKPTIICLDSDEDNYCGRSKIEKCSFSEPSVNISSSDLAYLIFTSGSSGRPKGVVVQHYASSLFLKKCREYFSFKPNLRFAHCSDLNFDPSIFDIFHCWQSGGTLVPMNKKEYSLNPSKFFENGKPDVVFTVPTIIKKALSINGDCLKSVKYLLLTGEQIPNELAVSLQKMNKKLRIFNMYGTTETAIVSHWCEITDEFKLENIVPVGKPLPDTRIYLLENGIEVPEGEIGECVVVTEQLALGYWGSSYQTEQNFKTNPLLKKSFQRAYFSGDLLRKGACGNYFYHGRMDNMIKINGKRVELGEIERAISEIENVENCCAVSVGSYDEKKLIAFVQLNGEKVFSEGDIVQYLRKFLPSHMLPSKVFVASTPLPLNKNGKLDRKKIQKEASNIIFK